MQHTHIAILCNIVQHSQFAYNSTQTEKKIEWILEGGIGDYLYNESLHNNMAQKLSKTGEITITFHFKDI